MRPPRSSLSRPRTIRSRLAVAALLAVTFAGLSPPAAPSAVEAGRPNLLVFMTDDQTLESLRVMPRVRRLLGDQGTTFANAFVSYPLCCPSRATYFTGQYSHNHGVAYHKPPTGGYRVYDGSRAFPVALRLAGYRTAHFGKYLNGYGIYDPAEVPPGWAEWYGAVDPSTYGYYGYTINHNGVLKAYGSGDGAYQTDVLAGLTRQFVTRQASRPAPFFANVAFLAPHSDHSTSPKSPGKVPAPLPARRHAYTFSSEPLPASASYNEADLSDKPTFLRDLPDLSPAYRSGPVLASYRRRLEALQAVDEAVGSIVAALDRTGQLDETVIVFTSDNGFFHGEHRLPYGKYLPYEEAIRVPLLLRGPGVPAGAVRRTLTANVDLAPTLLDFAGVAPLDVIDGRSLRPDLSDPGTRYGRPLLIETGENLERPAYQGIRSPRYLYVEHATGDRELYDLVRDPAQLESRHDDPSYATVEQRLSQRLDTLRTCAGATCR